MLHFVVGRAGTGKTTRIREEVAREIASSERPVVILVPEQQTVAWETDMARRLPPSANLRLEITNFTRLANAVFREAGGLADTVIDEGSRMLVVWRAMLSVWEELSVYGQGQDRSPGGRRGREGREDRNLPALTEAVDELKAAGITPAEAEEALARLEAIEAEERMGTPPHAPDSSDAPDDGTGSARESSGDLLSRLRDAVLVYAAYEEILHSEAIDRGDLPARLADKLGSHPYFAGKAVFIDSFYSLTAPQEKILSRVFAQADEVWISFACPPPSSRDLPGDERQFSEIRAFYKTAVRLADRCGKPFERIPLTENLRHKNAPALRRIERELFRYAGDADSENPPAPDGSVTVLRCADLYDEAQACASVVGRLLREGYACREIAVVARSFAGREGITDAALREQGIPCFLSESSAVSRSPAVRFVEAALAVGAGGWQRRDVIRYVKTGLTPAGDPDAEEPGGEDSGRGLLTFAEEAFETYTAAWNIRGRRMFTGADWVMNPAGYRPEFTEEGRAILSAANGARRRALIPLDRFLSVFDGQQKQAGTDPGEPNRAGRASVRKIAEGIVLLAEECGLEERLERLGRTYREIGMPKDGARAESGWDAVCRILDKMTAILGDTELDAGRFAGLFSRVAASMDAGTIPTGCDEVVLGSASGVRFDEVRCVILLGTVEGEFPGTSVSAGDFFDDRDKLTLESVGLVIGGPDASMQAAREAFMFYRAAASAGEKLVLLAPSSSGGSPGGGKNLSEGAARIALLSGAPVRTFGDLPLEEIVWHPAAAEYLLARRASEEDRAVLKRIAGLRKTAEVPLTAENDRIAVTMRETSRRLRLSQSKIETFLSCPFRFACRFRMKLEEEPKAEITAADVGNFVHHVLERYFASCSPDLPEEELRKAARAIIADYVDELSRMTLGQPGGQRGQGGAILRDGRLVYLFRRLERHTLVFLRAVSKELRQGAFAPAAFELPIGLGDRKNAVEPIRIKTAPGTPFEAEVTLDGIADRVDLWDAPDGKQYIRVVDYKTGSKPFSLERVRRGLDVQALLYLFAVWKNGLPKSGKTGSASEPDRERVPAAAVYFTVRPAPVTSSRMLTAEEAEAMAEERLGRVGVYLGDEDVLRAMDGELSGRFVPVKETKDGGWVGRGRTALLSLEEFGALYEEIGATVGKIAGAMRSGEAGASPRRAPNEDPCAYCSSRFVCRVV